MVPIQLMSNRFFRLDRRELLAGLGTALASSALKVRLAAARAPQTLKLEAAPAAMSLRPGQSEIPVWALQGPATVLRVKRGGELEVTFRNGLEVPSVLDWRGIDGAAAAEPLTAQLPLVPGAETRFAVPLRNAGTFLCDPRLVSDGQTRPLRPIPLVIEESEPPAIDRDEVFLIEDWRLRPDGTAKTPGTEAADGPPLYTVNGQILPDFSVRTHQRLRFRFINACQRQVTGLKIEGHDVRVMALDGEPAEPFFARNSALVLAPGGRVDVLIDAAVLPGASSQILLHDGREAHPVARLVASNEPPVRSASLPLAAALSSNGLSGQLDLKGALRVDLALMGQEWVRPLNFSASAPPAFQARAGRTVVLALVNRAARPTVFHLHGHHFRLLDRLDDGWKPFWLDSLAVEPGQTQRIAFAAAYPGRWLVEAISTDWAEPRLVRWYGVG